MVNTVWIDNLIKVLDYENKLYGQLLSMAESKTDVVVKGDIAKLQELVGKEQKFIGELGKLKDVREQILDQISRTTGVKSEDLTLSKLAELLPKEQSERLIRIRDNLQETIDKLKAKNDLNQQLIRNALEYVDFSLNLLTQPAPQTPQYGRKGTETGTKGGGFLDIKY